MFDWCITLLLKPKILLSIEKILSKTGKLNFCAISFDLLKDMFSVFNFKLEGLCMYINKHTVVNKHTVILKKKRISLPIERASCFIDVNFATALTEIWKKTYSHGLHIYKKTAKFISVKIKRKNESFSSNLLIKYVQKNYYQKNIKDRDKIENKQM